MTGRLSSPPPAPNAAAGIETWMELTALGDEMVEASYQRQFGPDKWIEPYRKRIEKLNEEKDRRLESILRTLAVAEKSNGG